ncbi:MAG: hydrogenase nickel incorporation protein HypB [Bacillota bacterium]|jgi:hydrogenase nickel incorporation protein HypB
MKIDVKQDIMEINNTYAADNRRLFKKHNLLTINLMGSPGAGKTSLLEQLLASLQDDVKVAVIEGDLATARDAERIMAYGVEVVQINTQGGCHLDAKMIGQVLSIFDFAKTDVLIIENVGNLVCPATFDLGEDFKMLVMSVTEGDDKPAKYPSAFLASQVVVLNKVDLLPVLELDLERMKQEIREINPHSKIFETSCAKNKVTGVDELASWLKQKVRK